MIKRKNIQWAACLMQLTTHVSGEELFTQICVKIQTPTPRPVLLWRRSPPLRSVLGTQSRRRSNVQQCFQWNAASSFVMTSSSFFLFFLNVYTMSCESSSSIGIVLCFPSISRNWEILGKQWLWVRASEMLSVTTAMYNQPGKASGMVVFASIC